MKLPRIFRSRGLDAWNRDHLDYGGFGGIFIVFQNVIPSELNTATPVLRLPLFASRSAERHPSHQGVLINLDQWTWSTSHITDTKSITWTRISSLVWTMSMSMIFDVARRIKPHIISFLYTALFIGKLQVQVWNLITTPKGKFFKMIHSIYIFEKDIINNLSYQKSRYSKKEKKKKIKTSPVNYVKHWGGVGTKLERPPIGFSGSYIAELRSESSWWTQTKIRVCYGDQIFFPKTVTCIVVWSPSETFDFGELTCIIIERYIEWLVANTSAPAIIGA